MKFPFSLLFKVGCLLTAYASFAQDTYQLVTNNRQLDETTRYIIVAKDYDVATSKPVTKQPYYLSAAAVSKSDDNTISNLGPDVSIYKLSDLSDNSSSWTKWRISFEGAHFLVNNGDNIATDEQLNSSGSSDIDVVSINVKSPESVDIKFGNKKNLLIRYDEKVSGFKRAESTSAMSDIVLYRKDVFCFRVDEDKSTSDKIVISSTWRNIKDNQSLPLKLHYIFNDGTPLSDDDVLEKGSLVECDTDEIEIPRSSDGNTLWIIGEVGSSNAKVRTVYSHLFKAELQESKPSVTGAEQYSIPEIKEYRYEEQVIIGHENDVKIYYTLDGTDPIVPENGSVPVPPTFDYDDYPIVYMGEQLNVKFVAVKDGYLPSEVVEVTITGEAKPLPKTDGNLYKPASKEYKLYEEVTFTHDSDVKIYYSLNGENPVVNITDEGIKLGENTFDLDEKPITYVGEALNIKYIAIKESCTPSDIISVTITGEAKPKPQTDGGLYKPESKEYTLNEEVTFNRNSEVRIYYTLDGTEPIVTVSDNDVTLGENTFDLDQKKIIYVGETLNIKYVAIKEGCTPSDVISVTITGEAKPKPQTDGNLYKPESKEYKFNEEVTFNRGDNLDVKIYYTLNGENPVVNITDEGIKLGENTFDLDEKPITYVGEALNIKYIAIKEGCTPSDVISVTITGEAKPKPQTDGNLYKPESKKYTLNEEVTFNRGDNLDVKIYYTLNGETPVVNITDAGIKLGDNTLDLDEKPITYVGESLNIRYIAIKEGCTPSDVISVTITGEAKPLPKTDGNLYKPESKKYTLNEEVTFNRDSEVRIYYTLDGTEPIVTVSDNDVTLGENTFDLDQKKIIYVGETLNIKYVAIKEGCTPSDVISVTITGEAKPKPQTDGGLYKPESKEYKLNEEVTFNRDSDVKIYYSLNGENPVVNITDAGIKLGENTFDLDEKPITYVGESLNIRYIAIKEGCTPSDVISVTITGEAKPKPQTDGNLYKPESKEYKLNEEVSFNRGDNLDVKIYYTLNGENPVVNITDAGIKLGENTFDLDEKPITYVGEALNIKYIAIKEGCTPSDVISVTITGEAKPKPQTDGGLYKPESKEYTLNEEVTFNRDSEVRIYYTLDGTEPIVTVSDNDVTLGENTFDLDQKKIIYVGETLNIKYVAIKEGCTPSDVISVTITGEAKPKPQTDGGLYKPENKEYKINEEVTFNRESNVKIYYTLDGTDPIVTVSDKDVTLGDNTFDLEEKPIIYLGEALDIKYIAIKEGCTTSDVISVTITGEAKPKPQTDGNLYKPESKEYKLNEEVTFNRGDNLDVKIYYTLNGENPVVDITDAGIKLGENTFDLEEKPITYIGEALNIRYIAIKEGCTPSDVISVTITGETKPLSKTDGNLYKPENKEYKLNEEVTFNRDSNVKIYYTLDGTDPIVTVSDKDVTLGDNTFDLDEKPITYIGEALNIKYIAVKEGCTPSDVISVTITGEAKPKPQTDGNLYKPESKEYKIGETIDFKITEDIDIYYTTDGTDPIIPDGEKTMGASTFNVTQTPLIYNGQPINLKFIAVKKDCTPSVVISMTLTGELKETKINEHFTKPADKEYELNEEVKFLRDKDVKIYYTIDGSIPSIPDDATQTLIGENTFDVDKTQLIYRGETINLHFIAVKEGYKPSEPMQMTIKGELLPTELNVHFWKPEEKQYLIHETVVFKRDSDVKIYYTTNGGNPTIGNISDSNSETFDLDTTPLVYEGDTITVKFIACKAGRKASDVVTVTITGEKKPVTELNSHFYILKESGYKFKEQVIIDRLGVVKIYYTLDGSDPVILKEGEKSQSTFDFDVTPIVYMGLPINLKLIAVKEGMLPSDIISITLTGEGVPVTTANQHFKRPVEKVYAMHEAIIFDRDEDVKIYYTLDSHDPVIEDAKTSTSQTRNSSHVGITYDLDVQSLTYEGVAMMIKFIAVKKDYLPSEVYTYYIGDDASALPSILTDSDKPLEYYDLNGIRIQNPLQPGIYIVRQGSETRKVLIQ